MSSAKNQSKKGEPQHISESYTRIYIKRNKPSQIATDIPILKGLVLFLLSHNYA